MPNSSTVNHVTFWDHSLKPRILKGEKKMKRSWAFPNKQDENLIAHIREREEKKKRDYDQRKN